MVIELPGARPDDGQVPLRVLKISPREEISWPTGLIARTARLPGMLVVESYRSSLDWPGDVEIITAAPHSVPLTVPSECVLVTELGIIVSAPGQHRAFYPHGSVLSISEVLPDEPAPAS
jgi:hypothetical protein